jgi:nucleotide-binding universal stress UspA family protein
MVRLFGSHHDHKVAPGYIDPTKVNRYTKKKAGGATHSSSDSSPTEEETHDSVDGGANDPNDSPEKPEIKEESPQQPEEPPQLDETQLNTKLNALLYHVSDDSIAMYKQENTSSDLLGRLYYDDYDSDLIISPMISGPSTPLMSPTPTGGVFHTVPSLGAIGTTSSNISSRSSLPRPQLSRLQSFERGISFDTSEDHRKSLTFKVKHPQFKFRRNNKTFLAGYNGDSESIRAIEWLFDEMVVHGDTIIVLQVLDEKKHQSINRDDANKALTKIQMLNTHPKKVSLVLEIVIGKPQKLLKDAITEYKPAMMIIGTHRHDTEMHKSLLPKASFSKYFLESALVPVILVKPNYHYVEFLETPIMSETYFEDIIKNIDLSETYLKHKHKRSSSKSLRMTLLSPSSSRALSPSPSRNGSFTNLAQLVPDRGRPRGEEKHYDTNEDDARSRSRSTSRSRTGTRFSKLFGKHEH